MSSSKNSNTTPSIVMTGFTLDVIIVASIILYVTGIAPIFFILLLGFVLAGVVLSTIWECLKAFLCKH